MFEKSYAYVIGGVSSIIANIKSGYLAIITFVPGDSISAIEIWEILVWVIMVFFGAMLGDIAKRFVGYVIQYHKKRMRLRRIKKLRS